MLAPEPRNPSTAPSQEGEAVAKRTPPKDSHGASSSAVAAPGSSNTTRRRYKASPSGSTGSASTGSPQQRRLTSEEKQKEREPSEAPALPSQEEESGGGGGGNGGGGKDEQRQPVYGGDGRSNAPSAALWPSLDLANMDFKDVPRDEIVRFIRQIKIIKGQASGSQESASNLQTRTSPLPTPNPQSADAPQVTASTHSLSRTPDAPAPDAGPSSSGGPGTQASTDKASPGNANNGGKAGGKVWWQVLRGKVWSLMQIGWAAFWGWEFRRPMLINCKHTCQ
ncbi:hypothetical protein IAT38_006751 [Cryptococcus sp. DSM 104549]